MKNISRILIIVFILISSIVLPSCSSNTDNANSLTNERLLQMLRIAPKGCGAIEFFDIETIRNDSDLAPIWNMMQENMYMDNEVESFAANCAIIFRVSDVEEKVAAIEQKSSFSNEYDGYTIWSSQEFDDPWVHTGDEYYITQIRDFIIIAESEEPIRLFIDVANGKEESLDYNDNIQEILGHLPDGYVISAFDFVGEYEHGLIASGRSITNEGNSAVYTEVVKCADAETAEAYSEEITKDAESISVTREDELVTVKYVDDDITLHTYPLIKPPPWWNE